MSEQLTSRERSAADWFREQSLDLLRLQLSERVYPGYPTERLTRQHGALQLDVPGRLSLPDGAWHMQPDQPIDRPMIDSLEQKGYRLDANNRPLHPWIDDLLAEDIGVVTGKGFYWHWGANYTADPIIIRTDTPELLILTVLRADTKQWALAGGFIEPNETGDTAALREAYEETEIDWRPYVGTMMPVYAGPLADIRVTANAWPETQAFGICLDPARSASLSTDPYVPINSEVDVVAWQTLAQTEAHMFGSHKLLIEMACSAAELH